MSLVNYAPDTLSCSLEVAEDVVGRRELHENYIVVSWVGAHTATANLPPEVRRAPPGSGGGAGPASGLLGPGAQWHLGIPPGMNLECHSCPEGARR